MRKVRLIVSAAAGILALPLPFVPFSSLHTHSFSFLASSFSFIFSFSSLFPLHCLHHCITSLFWMTAKPGPGIGQALGPLGLNMADFCKQFNKQPRTIWRCPNPRGASSLLNRTFKFMNLHKLRG